LSRSWFGPLIALSTIDYATTFRANESGAAGDPTCTLLHTKDIVMGNNFDQAKGKIKQAVGDLAGDKDLKNEGKADENAGKVKEFREDIKDKVEDAAEKIKDELTKH
jgi:uncharacterized protein YjbJ (UPF0337 family)